jgi:membrane protein DedA with SNARE-associated domain
MHPPEERTDVAGPSSDVAISDPIRRLALAMAVARYVIPLAALPLIPLLVRDHLPLLILLRPSKDLLLLGGGRAQVEGDPSLLLLFAVYVPLMMLFVIPFFVVGRAYRSALRAGEGPAWLQRAVPPHQLEIAQRVLARRGASIAILGRIAAVPPTVLAAAAGTSDIAARRYLAADAVGGVAAFAVTVGAGYALGQAYERGGIWLTVGGVAIFVGLVALLTRWVRSEARVTEATP